MKTIYKYPLSEGITHNIYLPQGAQILHVDAQPLYTEMPPQHPVFAQLTLWALVDTTAPSDLVGIRVVGTGEAVGDDFNMIHLGTVLMPSGLVWHVFRE